MLCSKPKLNKNHYTKSNNLTILSNQSHDTICHSSNVELVTYRNYTIRCKFVGIGNVCWNTLFNTDNIMYTSFVNTEWIILLNKQNTVRHVILLTGEILGHLPCSFISRLLRQVNYTLGVFYQPATHTGHPRQNVSLWNAEVTLSLALPSFF